jgi:sensor c-di-GMP phosphodiesterase-like protein
MSILSKLSALNTAVSTVSRVEMTDNQILQCKEAIKRDNRGYNVQPNRYDLNQPYRVALNYQNKWHNFGNFTSAHVAAAIGTIVSAAFFGAKAFKGEFDEELVVGDAEFKAWLTDARNADVIAKANGDSPAVHDGGEIAHTTTATADTDVNPF